MADFATELFDQLPALNETLNTYHSFLGDLAGFYSSCADLERQHATNVRNLVRKTLVLRSKRVAEGLIAGDAPSKAFRDGDEATRRHTLDGAYVRLLSGVDEEAQDRINLANSMETTAQEIRLAQMRSETLTKQDYAFYTSKLLAERDRVESERNKAKEAYDASCHALETARQKQDGEDKTQARFEKATENMMVAKNAYLVSIAVSNDSKHIFYERDLPKLHQHYQLAWTIVINKLREILLQGLRTTSNHIDTWKAINQRLIDQASAINPTIDQQIYVEYNTRPFFAPKQEEFVPCTVWHDTQDVFVQGDAKTYLQNLLATKQRELDTLSPKSDVVQSMEEEVLAATADPSSNDPGELAEKWFAAFRDCVAVQLACDVAQSEVTVALNALGGASLASALSNRPMLTTLKLHTDDVGLQQPHAFKSTTFVTPATCMVCQGSIWGIGRSGMTCRQCGLACHSKCEYKAQPNCRKSAPASRIARTSSVSTDQSSLSSSRSVKGAMRSVPLGVQPAPSTSTQTQTQAQAKQTSEMAYDYAAQTEMEVTVSANSHVTILEGDNQGWTMVETADGQRGLVPTSYLLSSPDLSVGSSNDQDVRTVTNEFVASGPDELSVSVGQQVEVLQVDSNGWARVKDVTGGQQGLVPCWAVGV